MTSSEATWQVSRLRGLHARRGYNDFILEYRNWEPVKDLERHDHSHILERSLKAVERQDQAHFWFKVFTYLSISDLSNHIRGSQNNPMYRDRRTPFPLKLPRTSLSQSLSHLYTKSRPQALPSTTPQKLVLLNELPISNLETWYGSSLWETWELSHKTKS